MWDYSALADHLIEGLGLAEVALRLEQAVYGLDVRDERAIQTLLTQHLSAHYSVTREVHYPSTAGHKKSHRQRCDLVLAPMGKLLRVDTAPASLFDPPDMCLPRDALWLEVKVAYQFREGNLRHGGYGAQWRQAVMADLKKMEAETAIAEAGLVLIVFNESPAVLARDLELFEVYLSRMEVLAGFRQVRSLAIQDRIGHQLCTAAVWPTLRRNAPG